MQLKDRSKFYKEDYKKEKINKNNKMMMKKKMIVKIIKMLKKKNKLLMSCRIQNIGKEKMFLLLI